MKIKLASLALCLLSACLWGQKLAFESPTFEDPHYRISLTLEFAKSKSLLKEVLVEGQSFKDFAVFQSGRRIDLDRPLEPGRYDLILDFAWKSGRAYRVAAHLQPEGAAKVQRLEYKGTSPQQGGIPQGKDGFYRLYRVEEEAGLERRAELRTIVLTAPAADVADGQFVLLSDSRPLPYQVLDRAESLPPEPSRATHPVTLTYKIAVPISAQPYEKKTLLVLKGTSSPAAGKAFSFIGEGLGKTVMNSRLSLGLSPKSGQVNTIDYLQEGVSLHNKAGVIHWNPDVFVPGVAWDHSFDWNPPPRFEERVGDLVYINSRQGSLPRIPEVSLDVRYTLESESPYFLSETCLRAEKDVSLIAARNDEMVLTNELFDALLYRDTKGALVQLPLKEKSDSPFGLVHIAADDLPWVGLLNTKRNYGFFSLRLEYINANLNAAGNFLLRPGTYFYAPSDGNYVYWVRPLLYTWAEHFTNTHFTHLPKGSFFYEKNAYVLLPLQTDTLDTLESLRKKLRHPLRVF